MHSPHETWLLKFSSPSLSIPLYPFLSPSSKVLSLCPFLIFQFSLVNFNHKNNTKETCKSNMSQIRILQM